MFLAWYLGWSFLLTNSLASCCILKMKFQEIPYLICGTCCIFHLHFTSTTRSWNQEQKKRKLSLGFITSIPKRSAPKRNHNVWKDNIKRTRSASIFMQENCAHSEFCVENGFREINKKWFLKSTERIDQNKGWKSRTAGTRDCAAKSHSSFKERTHTSRHEDKETGYASCASIRWSFSSIWWQRAQ